MRSKRGNVAITIDPGGTMRLQKDFMNLLYSISGSRQENRAGAICFIGHWNEFHAWNKEMTLEFLSTRELSKSEFSWPSF